MISNQKVSTKQMVTLLILDMFGAASLITPRLAVESASQDGWVIILVAGFLACVYAFFLTKLTRLFPGKSFTNYTKAIAGKYIAILLSIVLIVKLMILGAFEIRIFGELTNQMLLNRTPIEIIILVLLLIVVYLGRKGFEVRARLGEILIIFALLPIAFVFIFAVFSIQLSNLAPFFIATPQQVLQGGYNVSLRFVSIEFLLIGASFLAEPGKTTKVAFKAIGVVTVLHLIIFLVTVGIFGIHETANHIWPVIPMMKVVNLPEIFLDRQDALMMTFWMFTAFMYVNGIVFFVSYLIKDVFNLKRRDFIVFPLVPILYLLALIPNNVIQTYNWLELFTKYTGIVFSLAIPIILYAIAKIRGVGEEGGARDDSSQSQNNEKAS